MQTPPETLSVQVDTEWVELLPETTPETGVSRYVLVVVEPSSPNGARIAFRLPGAADDPDLHGIPLMQSASWEQPDGIQLWGPVFGRAQDGTALLSVTRQKD